MNPLGIVGIYLAPVPTNPLREVDLWFLAPAWHGNRLIQIVQSEGSFTQSFEDSLNMPFNGYLKLDMYAHTLTQLYKNPYG